MTHPPDPHSELAIAGVARRAETRDKPAPIALFFKMLAEVVSVLPAIGDSASERKKAPLIKGVLIGLGLLIALASYRAPIFIALGFAIMALAVPLPVRHAWRRDATRALRRRAVQLVTFDSPLRLVHDGRRLILERDGERVRRVLTDRRFDLQARRDADGELWLGVIPGDSKKKKDAIWVHFPDAAEASLAALDPARPDTPILLTAPEPERVALRQRLEQAHRAHNP